MKFVYGKNDWSSMVRGQENCYLLTNGLGGYSSMTMIGSIARNDHALLMAGMTAPNHRYHMITRMDEFLKIGDQKTTISSQEYINHTKNLNGFISLQQFRVDDFPIWIYQVDGIEIEKTIVMKHGENTLGIRYRIDNRTNGEIEFNVLPQMQFVAKGECMSANQSFVTTQNSIKSNGMKLFYTTNAGVEFFDTEYTKDYYYAQDARDGRDAIGKVAYNHRLNFTVEAHQQAECYLIYSTKQINTSVCDMLAEEKKRLRSLTLQSKMANKVSLKLVKSADQYIVDRESTKGKSIMAGYPFFADWGRDTMISVIGCCIVTKRFEEAKSIFRTFMKYMKQGLMPNMFPEGDSDPLYNTVDASLLFIEAVYEYFMESKDTEFVKEAYAAMEDIICWYQKGTDFHIKMDTDGLITAGSGLEQVTWMDVRFGDILPTPRHGKPVEINAYWYNDLKIMDYFSKELAVTEQEYNNQYEELSKKVRTSFEEKFWNEQAGCLNDVISEEFVNSQIRCNQIWAVSLPFTMLPREKEKMVVDKVFEKLYTPYGLRSLDKNDPDFKPTYGGSHFNRDMAYHQGTVWGFPLGGYYLAYLKVNEESPEAVSKVKEQLMAIEACMREGCIGHIAEIYDGENPGISKGCFAQAWSVSEMLRVFAKLEKL